MASFMDHLVESLTQRCAITLAGDEREVKSHRRLVEAIECVECLDRRNAQIDPAAHLVKALGERARRIWSDGVNGVAHGETGGDGQPQEIDHIR